jgi:predicted PurR-regulated permease PerM
MVGAIRVLDILVIVILILIAAALVYVFWPLILAVIIMAIGYFTYRWYTKRKQLR